MAETHPIRRLGTRAALLSLGMALGVTLAPRVVGAADEPPVPVDETESVVPATVAPPVPSSSTSTSTSSSTSTSTTTIATTPPPTGAPVLVPPLIDFRQPADVGQAARVNRVVVTPIHTQRPAVAASAELPFTGGGSFSILMSGVTALGIGGFALWWGSRKRPDLVPVAVPAESSPTE